MNIVGNSGIESSTDGSWPCADYSNTTNTEAPECEVEPTGQQMHVVQVMIHYLGRVVLPELYSKVPVNEEYVETVKRLRSDYREKNRELEGKLTKQRTGQVQSWRRSNWTLAG